MVPYLFQTFVGIAADFAFWGVVACVSYFRARIATTQSGFSTNFYLFEALVRLRFDVLKDLVAHMLMPALSLPCLWQRLFRNFSNKASKRCCSWITHLARVRGFTETQVILREALRNARTTLTLIGVQFTF